MVSADFNGDGKGDVAYPNRFSSLNAGVVRNFHHFFSNLNMKLTLNTIRL